MAEWGEPQLGTAWHHAKANTMKRRAFVTTELPIVLGLLVAVGLGIVRVIRFFAGEVPWYAWPLGGAAPPCLVIALGFVFHWIDSRHAK